MMQSRLHPTAGRLTVLIGMMSILSPAVFRTDEPGHRAASMRKCRVRPPAAAGRQPPAPRSGSQSQLYPDRTEECAERGRNWQPRTSWRRRIPAWAPCSESNTAQSAFVQAADPGSCDRRDLSLQPARRRQGVTIRSYPPSYRRYPPGPSWPSGLDSTAAI